MAGVAADAFKCICARGWTGDKCQASVNECSSSPCKNGGKCSDLQGSYSCECTPGFVGSSCATDKDECGSLPCWNGGTCFESSKPSRVKVTVDAFVCNCVLGWGQATCEHNIDDCSTKPCKNNGECKDFVNKYSCKCIDGFGGALCEGDNDECASKPCNNGGKCLESSTYSRVTLDRFMCDCAIGWEGSTCLDDIDECDSKPCLNGGTCSNNVGEYSCKCVDIFSGGMCGTAVNPCLSDAKTNHDHADECHQYADCIYQGPGQHTCKCKNGHADTSTSQSKGAGRVCVDADECASSPCKHGGACSSDSTVPLGTFKCVCKATWEGDDCSKDVNECLTNNGDCDKLMKCTNQEEGFRCGDCPKYYSRAGNRCKVDNACGPENPCHVQAVCARMPDLSYVCTCAVGNGWRPSSQNPGLKPNGCQDFASPVLSCPADRREACDPFKLYRTLDLGTVTITDNSKEKIAVTSTYVAFRTRFKPGKVRKVIFRGKDSSGNTGECSVSVTVNCPIVPCDPPPASYLGTIHYA